MSQRRATNIVLASLMMLFTTGIVYGEDSPFVFVELPLPGGYTIDADSQVDINLAGDVLATLLVAGSVSELAVWKDEDYAFTPEPPDVEYDTVIARQINDAGFVVGQTNKIATSVVYAFIWNPDTGVYTITEEEGSGYDLNNDAAPDSIGLAFLFGQNPVAYIDEDPFPLLGLDNSYQAATSALGIDPDHPTNLWIAGVSETDDPVNDPLHAVIWSNVANPPHDLTPASATADHVAWQVSTLGDVIGYKVDGNGNPDEGYFWENQGGTTWTQETLTNIIRPWGLNTFGEVVGDGSTATEAWLRVKSPNPAGEVLIPLHDAVGVPDGVIHSFRVSSISDAGEIAGVIDYTPLGAAPRIVAPFKLVPYNVDNDTGGTATTGPDYRQVIAEESEGSNWIPDSYDGIRFGFHAPSIEARAVDNISAVRFIRNRSRIDTILTDPDACETECIALDKWARGLETNDGRHKEVIVTFRSEWDGDPDLDAVPLLLADRQAALDNIRQFSYNFNECFDYAQIGNEFWTGNGKYHLDITGGSCAYIGDLASIGPPCLDIGLEIVFDWMSLQMKAARDGSALAGRPVRVIGPAITNKEIRNAENETCASNEKRSRMIDRVSKFANSQGVPLDVHYHFVNHVTEVEEIDTLLNNPLKCWTKPNRVVTLEYGPEASDAWFLTGTNVEETERFLDNDCDTHPDNAETWDEWTDDWYLADQALHDLRMPLPNKDIESGVLTLEAASYEIVCYAPTAQTGATVMGNDFAAVIQTAARDLPVGQGCQAPNTLVEPWATQVPAAGLAVLNSIAVFQPHPNACDCSFCPE